MFILRISSPVRVFRSALLSPVKHSRFLSVQNVLFTKKASPLLYEKENKVTKAKKYSNEKPEASKLYPDEWDKLSEYDITENFNFMNDNHETLPEKENPSPNEPQTVTNEPQLLKEEKMVFKEVEMKGKEFNLMEKMSSSDSDSDTEKNEHNFQHVSSKRGSHIKVKYLPDVHVNYLPKRSDLLRSEMEMAKFQRSDVLVTGDSEVYHLAKLGKKPKKIFFTTFNSISSLPFPLCDVELYQISYEDLRYWTPHNSKSGIIAFYSMKDLKSQNVEEQSIPLTLICSRIKHRQTMECILNSVSACSPKNFITAEDCLHPLNKDFVSRTSLYALTQNCDLSLTWQEIVERVNTNDKVLVVHGNDNSSGEESSKPIYSNWSSLPTVDLYSDLWDEGNITLIIVGRAFHSHNDNVLEFCRDRKAQGIAIDIKKKIIPGIFFNVVLFELRRQWLAKRTGTAGQHDAEKKSKNVVSKKFQFN